MNEGGNAQLIHEKMIEEDDEAKNIAKQVQSRYSQRDIDDFAEILNQELSKDSFMDDTLHKAFIKFNETLQKNIEDPYLFDLIAQFESIQLNLQELIISFNLRTGMVQPAIAIHLLSNFCTKFKVLFFDEIFLIHIIERIDNPKKIFQTAINLESNGSSRVYISHQDEFKIRRHLIAALSNILANIEITDVVRDILLKCIPIWIENFDDEVIPHIIRMIVNIYKDDENGVEQREILLNMLLHFSFDIISEACECISFILSNYEDESYIPRVIDNICKIFQERGAEVRECIPFQKNVCKLFVAISSKNEWFFDSVFEKNPVNVIYDIIQPDAYGYYFEMIARLIPLYSSKILFLLAEYSLIGDLFESVLEASSSDVALILSALSKSLENIDSSIAFHIVSSGILGRFAELAPNDLQYAKEYLDILSRSIFLIKELPQNIFDELKPHFVEIANTEELTEAADSEEFDYIIQRITEQLQEFVDCS